VVSGGSPQEVTNANAKHSLTKSMTHYNVAPPRSAWVHPRHFFAHLCVIALSFVCFCMCVHMTVTLHDHNPQETASDMRCFVWPCSGLPRKRVGDNTIRNAAKDRAHSGNCARCQKQYDRRLRPSADTAEHCSWQAPGGLQPDKAGSRTCWP
jgi:hypothetical protein